MLNSIMKLKDIFFLSVTPTLILPLSLVDLDTGDRLWTVFPRTGDRIVPMQLEEITSYVRAEIKKGLILDVRKSKMHPEENDLAYRKIQKMAIEEFLGEHCFLNKNTIHMFACWKNASGVQEEKEIIDFPSFLRFVTYAAKSSDAELKLSENRKIVRDTLHKMDPFNYMYILKKESTAKYLCLNAITSENHFYFDWRMQSAVRGDIKYIEKILEEYLYGIGIPYTEQEALMKLHEYGLVLICQPRHAISDGVHPRKYVLFTSNKTLTPETKHMANFLAEKEQRLLAQLNQNISLAFWDAKQDAALTAMFNMYKWRQEALSDEALLASIPFLTERDITSAFNDKTSN